MFHMKPSAGRTFACTLALLASALTFLAFGAASAYATTSCAKKVLADWFDNRRIDGFYPLHCYQEAIAAVPPEQVTLSTDCGMKPLARMIAKMKLRALADGARIVRKELGVK